MKLIHGIRRLSPVLSTIMCRDLGAVAAEVHAAPSARPAPARVVEEEDARRAPALPYPSPIAFAKQIGGVFGNGNEQV